PCPRRTRSSCSTTPTRRSITIARSCRPRSTRCARASRCSTRTCSSPAGTDSSARCWSCRRSSPASDRPSRKSCAPMPPAPRAPRGRARTEEHMRHNAELGHAKGEAEKANTSKTRFLAAASHDILQPLNAARLYVTSLVERQRLGEDAQLIGNIDASLDAVEEIFGALLDISRLDTGAMKPEIVSFRIVELLRQ